MSCSGRGGKTLIDDPPKRDHRLRFSIEEILKKSTGVQRRRIGVPLALLASFCHPVVWFVRVDNLKEARRIEIRAALIVQNAEIVSLNPNHDIRQTGSQIRISRVLSGNGSI